MVNVSPVILCGGSGTRLSPLSLAGFPKQFLVLSGTTSLFQQPVDRVNQLGVADITVGNPLIVTNEEHRFLSLEQLREVKHNNATLILEPTGRTTAPALTLAALQATEVWSAPLLGSRPSRSNGAKHRDTSVPQAMPPKDKLNSRSCDL